MLQIFAVVSLELLFHVMFALFFKYGVWFPGFYCEAVNGILNVLIDDPSEVKVSFLSSDATFEKDKCGNCTFCTICCSIFVSEKGKRAIYQFLVTRIRPSDRHWWG